jgi:hypothetical protein
VASFWFVYIVCVLYRLGWNYNFVLLQLFVDVYFRNLPEHERIVSLRGSVIDRAFSSSRCETAVLLIMDRYIKDLYVAIKCGLDTVSRYYS